MFCNMIMVVVHRFIAVKTHQILFFKWMQFIISKFNEAEFFNESYIWLIHLLIKINRTLVKQVL